MLVFYVYSAPETVQGPTSLTLLRRFVINKLKSYSIQILSLFDDKLLVGHTQSSLLFIYKCNGSHHTLLSTVQVNAMLLHAMWTPRGNIIYIADEVVTVTDSDKDLVSTTRFSSPLYLSVFNNESIYIADHNIGIFQSIDEGITWDHFFKQNDAWIIYQAFRTTNYLWTWQMLQGREARLCVYIWDDQLNFDNIMPSQTINNVSGSNDITFHPGSLLVIDNINILYSDKSQSNLNLFSASGHYQRKLLILKHVKNESWSLAIDKEGLLLYVGQTNGVVEVFKLNYQ